MIRERRGLIVLCLTYFSDVGVDSASSSFLRSVRAQQIGLQRILSKQVHVNDVVAEEPLPDIGTLGAAIALVHKYDSLIANMAQRTLCSEPTPKTPKKASQGSGHRRSRPLSPTR
jgi:hypothetical protein